jgi:hypothetical protein
MLLPIFIPGEKVPVVSFRGSLFSDTINTRTYSTTIDLGPEDPSRLIVVATACLLGAANPPEAPTTCTVDGASATLAVERTEFALNELPVQLWYVARPTGGSVTVAFNKPGGVDMDRGALGVWSIYYLKSHTPVATANNRASPCVLDLNVSSGAAVLAAGNIGTAAITWGFTGVTQDAVSGAQLHAAFASASAVASATPRDIELSGGSIWGVSACWR